MQSNGRARIYDFDVFDKEFGYYDPEENYTLVEKAKNSVRTACGKCTPRAFLTFLLSFIPITSWLPVYKVKKFLLADVISGITVGIMNIPQGMAYGMLTGLQPVFGLYTSLFPPLFYCLFGTSKHLSFGTFAVISLLVSSAVDKEVNRQNGGGFPNTTPLSPIGPTTMYPCIPVTVTPPGLTTQLLQDVNELDYPEYNPRLDITLPPCPVDPNIILPDLHQEQRIEITMAFTMLVGLVMVTFGILHIGFVASYLSDQLVQGMTTGAACFVLTSQVSSLLGLQGIKSNSGTPLGIFQTYIQIFSHIKESNYVVCTMSAVCLIVLAVYKDWIAPFLKRRLCSFPFPIELIVVVFATLASYLMDLKTKYNVVVVGAIPSGFRTPAFPQAQYFSGLLPDAIITAVVIFSLGVSMGKIFAMKQNYRLDSNQEWYAFGLSHIFSSYFGCHCAGGSLSRSLVQENQGGKTQVASLVSCVIIMLVLLVLAGLFQTLPKCALAAIIAVALKGMFMQFKELRPLWRNSKIDFLVWIVSFLAVILLGISYGLIGGVAFAIVTVIYRSQWPESRSLGKTEGLDDFRVQSVYQKCHDVPGVKIFRFDAALYFANVELFRETLYKSTGLDPIVEKERIRKLNKRRAKQEKLRLKALQASVDCSDGEKKELKKNKFSFGSSNKANGHAPVQDTTSVDLLANRETPARVHHVIIDCSSFPYMDSMGVNCLRDIFTAFKDIEIVVLLANVKLAVRQLFTRCRFYDVVPKSHLYVSLHDAVSAAVLSHPKPEYVFYPRHGNVDYSDDYDEELEDSSDDSDGDYVSTNEHVEHMVTM